MTINAPAALLLLCYELVAAERGIPGDALRGTVQNDVLKEYVARGNYIFPPRPSMRLTTDLFAYCAERIPRWNTISISGYHIREAGSTRRAGARVHARERHRLLRGGGRGRALARRRSARVSPSSSTRTTTCCRRWRSSAPRGASGRGIMRDRFGATSPKAQALRFHAQTGGSTLTAQQPENNLVRVAAQALSAVYGGAQSIHTNGVRRGARAADRARGDARAPHAADPHARGGHDGTADPLGGLVVRRGAHRRARGSARAS